MTAACASIRAKFKQVKTSGESRPQQDSNQQPPDPKSCAHPYEFT